jgi:hypothetical protein
LGASFRCQLRHGISLNAGVFWQLRFQAFSTGKAAEIVTSDLAPRYRKADIAKAKAARERQTWNELTPLSARFSPNLLCQQICLTSSS